MSLKSIKRLLWQHGIRDRHIAKRCDRLSPAVASTQQRQLRTESSLLVLLLLARWASPRKEDALPRDYRERPFDVFSPTASRISALKAASSSVSSLWESMARTVLLSRRVLKRFFGSFSCAPFG